MKKNIFYLVILFTFFMCYLFFSSTDEKYILPNNYKGFFTIFYKDIDDVPEIIDKNRKFYIDENGICISEKRYSLGSVNSKFYFKDNNPIKKLDVTTLSYATEMEVLNLKKSNELFVVEILGFSMNKEQELDKQSIHIFFIGSGNEIYQLYKNIEYIYFYITGKKWSVEKNDLIKLNNEINNEFIAIKKL